MCIRDRGRLLIQKCYSQNIYVCFNHINCCGLQVLNFDVERNESLNLKGETLGAAECETLEEILKRVQFIVVNLEGTCIDDEVSVTIFYKEI